jgi:lipopolysaccharide/colanic/teichoic acid biosynthesis glycosyltransferase
LRLHGSAYDPLKRMIDVLVAGLGIIVTAPLQAVIALIVRLRLGAPVLFRQERPGKDEKLFELVKFRTMLDTDPSMGLVSDEQRMTRLGSALRASSLDELPTLWNVLKGDMSLVGPRPLLVQYLGRYDEVESRRHEVRPGVTGLAQVNGRNAISWEQKFAHDVAYVDSRSLFLDLRIVVKTFVSTLRRVGITADGDVTMPEFTRSPDAG